VFALVVSLLAFLLIQPAAHAHVSVISTSPQYQTAVDQLPSEVVIEFNSPLIVLGSKNPNTLEVVNPSGASITTGQVTVDGAKISSALNQEKAVAGEYTVRYRVVSTDGHGVSGSYRFTLAGTASANPEASAPAPSIDSEHGFWHVHALHVYEGAFALLAIGIWWLYRARFAHRK